MKKLCSLLLVFLALAAVFTGCSGTKSGKLEYEYKTLSLMGNYRAQDGYITFSKPEDQDTTFSWSCQETSGEFESSWEEFVTDKETTTDKNGLPVAPSIKKGFRVWQFAVRKNSEAVFTLTQINTVTGGVIRTETYNVKVDGKGAVTVG